MTDERSQLLQMDFEAWALIHLEHLAHDLVLDTTWGGTYANKEVEAAWKAWSWQAARATPAQPRQPDPALIESMCMRYRHDWGLLDDEQTKEATRTTMRQLWEEVVGLGFYKAPAQPAERVLVWRQSQDFKWAEVSKHHADGFGQYAWATIERIE
jgi:hypothetical protein